MRVVHSTYRVFRVLTIEIEVGLVPVVAGIILFRSHSERNADVSEIVIVRSPECQYRCGLSFGGCDEKCDVFNKVALGQTCRIDSAFQIIGYGERKVCTPFGIVEVIGIKGNRIIEIRTF
jgi:hypothetical protein